MTAEVAILNKTAIVVAADSAVTVGENKVHRFANKIFQICDATPMGMMVFGFAEHCGIPWETVAKVFRSRFGQQQFATVASCFDELRKFLGSSQFLTQDAQDANLVYFALDVVGTVAGVVADAPKRQMSAAIKVVIEKEINRYQRIKDRIVFPAVTLLDFRRQFGAGIGTVCDEVFGELDYKVPARLRASFVKLVWTALFSGHRSEFSAGVAVFGFGEDQLLPDIVSQEFDGSCCGALRSIPRSSQPVTMQNPCKIVPFADRIYMDSFIEVVNRRTRRFMTQLMKETAQQVAERVIKDNFSPTPSEQKIIKAFTDKAIGEILKKQNESARKWIMEDSVMPILNILRTLPKEEMAALAEALVEVTALRTKVSSAVETVGGDVDVCVVTKGDGLIWIKRKHYFDATKNQQYTYRRFGRVLVGQGGKNGQVQ